jgi:acetyltransferase-like isoleucine patch superfamily enzyme
VRQLRRTPARLRVAAATLSGARFGPGCSVATGVKLTLGFFNGSAGEISVGRQVELEDGVILNAHGGRIDIHDRVFIGPYAVIYGHGGVEIGAGSLVSMHCRILSSNHAVPDLSIGIRSLPDVREPTRIGADVWLGSGVTVLAGVTIGAGCVVGAGAVVAHDLAAGAIAVGVPAKVVRRRPGSRLAPSPGAPKVDAHASQSL